jgi:hypothetical protein
MKYLKFQKIFLILINSLLILIFTFVLHSQTQEKKKEINNNQTETLKLEKSFPGPFRDTVIQRIFDQKNNVVCYLYIPVIAEALKPATEKTPRIYGPNSIGSISCVKR